MLALDLDERFFGFNKGSLDTGVFVPTARYYVSMDTPLPKRGLFLLC